MEILAGSLAVAVLVALAILTWAVPRLRGGDPPTTGEPGDRGGLTRRSFVRLGAACGAAIGVFGARRALGGEAGRVARSGGCGGAATAVERVEPPVRVDPYPYSRVMFPMSSGINVPVGGSMLITNRGGQAFRPERLVVASSEDWWIEDIVIGGASQFDGVVHRGGGVPGWLFGAAAPQDSQRLSMPIVQSCVDLSIRVRYIGASKCGAQFFGCMVGSAVS